MNYVIDEDKAKEELAGLSDNARMFLLGQVISGITIVANLESYERRMDEVALLRKNLKQIGLNA